jgi:hypothetical protein
LVTPDRQFFAGSHGLGALELATRNSPFSFFLPARCNAW